MKATVFASLIVAALSVHAHPSAKRADAIDDVTVLNFALTLEHLENAFYTEGLAKFDEAAFAAAGLPEFARGRFLQVAQHEKAHVDFLTSVLGDKATKPCTYKFPYTDAKSFAAVSQALEGTGASAYSGAAQLISSKDSLTAAATILSTEARHSSFIGSALEKGAAWSGSFETPLGLNEVFSIASAFIVSCPASNPPLPVTALPPPTLTGAAPGKTVTPVFDAHGHSGPFWVVFFTGLNKVFLEVTNGKITIPINLLGTTYAVITTSGTVADASTIITGAAMFNFDFDSRGKFIVQ